jgi:hypothetical protein
MPRSTAATGWKPVPPKRGTLLGLWDLSVFWGVGNQFVVC